MKTILTFLLFASAAYPATILQDQFNGAGVFGGIYPFKGQSFLAEDPFLSSIGVRLQVANPHFGDTAVNLSLFSGRGIDGPLLAQRTLTPPTGSHRDTRWLDFDFSGVPVFPGETYTFTIQAPTPYWAVQDNTWATQGGVVIDPEYIDYPGGQLFVSGEFRHYADLTFRVETIPEPGIAVLLLAGLVGLWFWRRS